MNTVAQIKTWPNDTIVDAIQGVITKAYESKTVNTAYGAKTVQSGEFRDSKGDTIRLSVWDHADIRTLEGKEVVISAAFTGSGKRAGLKVVHKSYTNKAGVQVNSIDLEVGKVGQFQLVEVYGQKAAGGGVDPQAQSNPVKTDSKAPYVDARAEGQRLGMCFKLAGDFFIAENAALTEDQFVTAVKSLTAKLVQASKELEASV